MILQSAAIYCNEELVQVIEVAEEFKEGLFLLLNLLDLGGEGVAGLFEVADGFDALDLGLLFVGGAELGDDLLCEEAAARGIVLGRGVEAGPAGLALAEVEEEVEFGWVGRGGSGDADLGSDCARVSDEGLIIEIAVLRIAVGDVYAEVVNRSSHIFHLRLGSFFIKKIFDSHEFPLYFS